LNEER